MWSWESLREGGEMVVIRIVEDSWDVSGYLKDFLTIEGHIVLETNYGFADLLTPERWDGVDVAIVDLRLGEEISGEDVLRYLKKSHPYIKRIIFSAYPQFIDQNNDLADVVLEKPTSAARILEAIV